MGNSEPESGDVFDIQRIRRLVELMQECDLSEIDLRQEEQRIQLKRNSSTAPIQVTAPQVIASAPVAAASPPASMASETDANEKNIVSIKSPMVGTFYTKANPDASTFVKVGDHVGPETTVCIIEAMKVFNEISAEVSGQIVSILCENEEPVDFGKPMFKVDTSK